MLSAASNSPHKNTLWSAQWVQMNPYLMQSEECFIFPYVVLLMDFKYEDMSRNLSIDVNNQRDLIYFLTQI